MILFLSLFCIVVSFVLLKIVIQFSYKKKVFDDQGGRKIHTGNIPRVGGIAFVPAAIISFVIFLVIFVSEKAFGLGVHNIFMRDALVILCAIAIIYVFGLLDDIKGLRYRVKFGYQIVTGLLLCFSGIFLWNIHGILGLYEIPISLGFVVTIFMMVLSINAFNFIDGIDGLSSGIAILSLIYYSIILYLNGNMFYMLSILFMCALLPFFFFNVFGKQSNKTKSFMGDTGSTVLGISLFLMAVTVNEDVNSKQLYENPFVLGFTPLLLPFYDVFNVVFYRLLKGKNPFKADANHFHHKLLGLGLSQHATLVVELIVFVLITVITLLLVKYINLNIIIGCSIILWISMNVMLTNIINKRTITKK